MTPPLIPGLTAEEQALLYGKLNVYNQGRASYKEAGAYLVVLPREGHPAYTLWIYSPLPGRQHIFYLCELSTDVNEALRVASTLCYYSERRMLMVEYNTKRMQSNGDDLIPVGKYRGHFLHEILSIDPAYLSWLGYKFRPRIPKQERFAHIARIYCSVHADAQRAKARRRPAGRFLGKEGDRVENLRLTVTHVRLEDNPYKTQVRGGTPFFYVRQVLWLKDAAGNHVTFRMAAHTSSRESGVLPALEHAFRPGEVIEVKSARISRTYVAKNVRWTRLAYVKFAAGR